MADYSFFTANFRRFDLTSTISAQTFTQLLLFLHFHVDARSTLANGERNYTLAVTDSLAIDIPLLVPDFDGDLGKKTKVIHDRPILGSTRAC